MQLVSLVEEVGIALGASLVPNPRNIWLMVC